MSNGTKTLIIVGIILIAVIVLVCLAIRKIKRKVKNTMEKVDHAGEYAGRIMRIAGKVTNGETKAMLQGIAEDFDLSEVKTLFTSDDKLDAILDILETEADAEEVDSIKLSEAAVSLKNMLLESRKK